MDIAVCCSRKAVHLLTHGQAHGSANGFLPDSIRPYINQSSMSPYSVTIQVQQLGILQDVLQVQQLGIFQYVLHVQQLRIFQDVIYSNFEYSKMSYNNLEHSNIFYMYNNSEYSKMVI